MAPAGPKPEGNPLTYNDLRDLASEAGVYIRTGKGITTDGKMVAYAGVAGETRSNVWTALYYGGEWHLSPGNWNRSPVAKRVQDFVRQHGEALKALLQG
jgi:hypothetical protein